MLTVTTGVAVACGDLVGPEDLGACKQVAGHSLPFECLESTTRSYCNARSPGSVGVAGRWNDLPALKCPMRRKKDEARTFAADLALAVSDAPPRWPL